MDRTERFYRIDQLLLERRVVPLTAFLEELEISEATFKRDLEYLRDRFNAPIVWDRGAGGYRYQNPSPATGPRFALPGMWFNAEEILSLLTMERLLDQLQPGFLKSHLAPLRTRLHLLLGNGEHPPAEVMARIRVLPMGGRRVQPPLFQRLAGALLERRRVRLSHLNRQRGEVVEREVSPQRLVYYRDNWYLDGWCHLRRGVRSFALDAIQRVTPLARPARELPAARLDQELGAGYGIFAGHATRTARLRFSPIRSRWVARESWHPRQRGEWDPQGRWILSFPYAQDPELVMDILRHGPEVEVLDPPELRAKVAAKLREALSLYGS